MNIRNMTAWLLAVLLTLSLFAGCAPQKEELIPDTPDTEPIDETLPESETAGSETTDAPAETPESESDETAPTEETITAPASVFPVGTPSAYDQTAGEFYTVSEMSGEYVSVEDDVTYLNVLDQTVFEITGMTHPTENEGEFYRLDAADRPRFPDGNKIYAEDTTGGRIRFRTTASVIVIRADIRSIFGGMQMTTRGMYGFDVYVGSGSAKTYVGGQMQDMTGEPTMVTTVALPDNGGIPQEVTVNLPLYGGITKMEIGFKNAADTVALPTPYTYEKPVVFYGSSITQGGCVSRPGNAYCHVVTRALDASCINLGFAGTALGEATMAEYIGELELSAFVMDYDYNSPSADTLRKTHQIFYKIVRKAHPDTPIIFLCHPYYGERTEEDEARIAVIRSTYEKAVEKGDENVWFIDSETYFPEAMRDLYAVDNLHPNDLGHYAMAEALYPVLKEALEKNAAN